MSVFGTDPTPEGQDIIANDPNVTSVVDQLVGEGKKFKTVEEALQGKIESDTYIETLKAQMSTLEARVAKDDRMDELLTQLQAKANDTPAPIQQETPPSGSTPELNESALKSLVDSAIRDNQTDATLKANLSQADAALVKEFGTEAKAKVLEKAKELYLSVDSLEKMAGESPTAFLSLMGAKMPVSGTLPLVGSSNTDAQTPNGTRNNAYYSKLRKENKTNYYSSKVQNQKLQDAMAQGSSFYNT